LNAEDGLYSLSTVDYLIREGSYGSICEERLGTEESELSDSSSELAELPETLDELINETASPNA
jgi:hypothetical protein